jgi:hypothetical protein
MDPRVTELQCIMPMANIPSVLKHGICCNDISRKLRHISIAMDEMQKKRAVKRVPGGLRLHEYANLYFHARNPMMSKRRTEADTTCVLKISTDVLRLDGVVITDQNAASDYVRFYAPNQWKELNFDRIYAVDWRHPGDAPAYYRHSSQKCAEVLVPNCVEPKHIVGAYVVDVAAQRKLEATGFELPIKIDGDMFFR